MLSFREKRCCQRADKQHLAAVKNKGSRFQHWSGLKILELMSFADVFFQHNPASPASLSKHVAPRPVCCKTTSHFSSASADTEEKKAQHSLTPRYSLLMKSALVNTRLHVLIQVPLAQSSHHTNNSNFTLTCSFSCLMDCWRVSIWLNKGLLRVFRRTARFSWCWESLFSCSFACSRSRICSTCCLSAPQRSPG